MKMSLIVKYILFYVTLWEYLNSYKYVQGRSFTRVFIYF
jgi:hypothetical protein